MTMIVDAAVSSGGETHLLCDDGTILAHERIDSLAYQHLPQSQRPTHAWRRFAGPPVVVPTRIIVDAMGRVLVLGDGRLWERVQSDDTAMVRPVFLWREMPLPDDLAVPQPTPAPSVSDTFEARRQCA